MQWQSAEACCKSIRKVGLCPTPYARIDTLLRSPCSLNFPNLSDNFVKILVSKIRKCHQLQGGFVPLTPDQGLCPWTPLWLQPPNPHYIIWPPLSCRSGSASERDELLHS